jgi:hypothetical protein
MEKTEKDSIFDWISKIIESSNNTFHFEAVDRLIDLYFEKFQDDKAKTELFVLRQTKWESIHDILI